MKESTRNWLAIAFVVSIAVAFVVGMVVSPSPSTPPPPKPQAIAPACHPNPTAAINATPAGGTWFGSGCYDVTGGSAAPTANDITIDGGTFEDTSTTAPAKGGLKPIFRLQDLTGDTIENVTVLGANLTGNIHDPLVGEAGFKLINTHNLTFINDTASQTYGDCMEVFAEPGAKSHSDTAPNTGLLVNGFKANNCGRDGLSPSDVNGATFNDLTIGHAGQASIDFESDLNLGAGNVVFNGGSWAGTIFEETLTGPITFNNATLGSHVEDTSTKAFPYPITFNGGSLAGWPKASQAVIILRGPNSMTFHAFTFTRQPSKKPPPLWNVIKGGQLTLSASTLAPPLGNPAAGVKSSDGSLVTVSP